MSKQIQHFKVGKIVNTQGLKGELKIYPLTNDIARFDDLDEFYIDEKFEIIYEVERVRYKGNMIIMKIKGIDTIEIAERFRDKFMYVDREKAVKLDEGEFFIADLIGLEVFTKEGKYVGKLKEVLQYSANDVYLIEGEIKEYMIPAVNKFVPEINLEENKMIIDPIKGMID